MGDHRVSAFLVRARAAEASPSGTYWGLTAAEWVQAAKVLEPDPDFDPSDAGEWAVWERASEEAPPDVLAAPFILVSRRDAREHPAHEAWTDEIAAQIAADRYNAI